MSDASDAVREADRLIALQNDIERDTGRVYVELLVIAERLRRRATPPQGAGPEGPSDIEVNRAVATLMGLDLTVEGWHPRVRKLLTDFLAARRPSPTEGSDDEKTS